jgi:hypothetical protein
LVSVPDVLGVSDPSSDWLSGDSWLRASEVSVDSSVSVPETETFEYCKPDARLATRIIKKGNIVTFFMGLFTGCYNYANY